MEVGTEPYQLPVAFQQLGYEVVGLDLYPNHGSLIIEGQDLNILQTDLNQDRFPLKADSVDMVIFSDLFEHLINPLPALCVINRVLRSNGTLLITTPNLYRPGKNPKFVKDDGFADGVGQWVNWIGSVIWDTFANTLEVKLLNLSKRPGSKYMSQNVMHFQEVVTGFHQ